MDPDSCWSVKLTDWLFCPIGQEANTAVDGGYRTFLDAKKDVFMPMMKSGQLRQESKSPKMWLMGKGGMTASSHANF